MAKADTSWSVHRCFRFPVDLWKEIQKTFEGREHSYYYKISDTVRDLLKEALNAREALKPKKKKKRSSI